MVFSLYINAAIYGLVLLVLYATAKEPVLPLVHATTFIFTVPV